MWVYQNPNLNDSSDMQESSKQPQASSENKNPMDQTEAKPVDLVPERPVPVQIPKKPALPRFRAGGQATRDCAALACAYLFGTALAGAAYALCEANEKNLLAFYLNQWVQVFSVDEPEQILGVFAAQYGTVAAAVTAIFLLGLCAFGPVLIYLFAMLYGLGVGLIGIQLFLDSSWGVFPVYPMISGLSAACVAACLCFFGASALQVSSRLQKAAFSRRECVGTQCDARVLLGQYLMFDVILLPLCGLSTGLVCLVHKLSI